MVLLLTVDVTRAVLLVVVLFVALRGLSNGNEPPTLAGAAMLRSYSLHILLLPPPEEGRSAAVFLHALHDELLEVSVWRPAERQLPS